MSDLGPAAPSTTRRTAKTKPFSNGTPDSSQDLLHALQAMRSGDFSVRMTGNHLGIEGKIADTFNEIVAANQRMAQQLERVGQVVGREGKTRQRVKFGLASGSWADMEGSVNTLIDDPLWATRGGTGAAAAGARRIPAIGHARQHDDQAALRLHLRGDARGARGRHRRQVGRPGAGPGSD